MRFACWVVCLALPACSLARTPLSPLEPRDAGRDAPGLDADLDAPPDAGTDGGPIGDPLGTVCSDGTTCLSGHCADGVCCDAACDGPCVSCTAGIDGRCAPALVGTDPENDCATEAESTCGTSGACDGEGACALHPSSTVCVPPSCVAGVQTDPRTCDGAGTCAAGGTTPCASGCDGSVCAGSCASDAMCAAGTFCQVATGLCVPLLPNGATASVATHCTSGHVADGVCCETDCAGLCASCRMAATGAADGLCRPSTAGTDPDSECTLEAPSTCGSSGSCDGAGACDVYASGTECAAASCAGGLGNAADTCDGAGTCNDGGTTLCAPYTCGATSCRTTCTMDAHCAAGNFCSAAGSCVAQGGLGAACTRGGECAGGRCVDGVCCDGACSGTCEACSIVARGGGGVDGTCGPVTAGADPGNECTAQSASTCGTTGSCSGARTCALFSAGTECGAASCVGSTGTAADLCDGAGTCIPGATAACAPFGCDASGACRTSCTTAADCASGAVCVGTVCRVPLSNGSACTSGAVCASGNCVDGFCCTTACAGACMACAASMTSGANGTCLPVRAGTDPSDECTMDPVSSCDRTGMCNGAGACAVYAAGTVCAAASCASSTASNADTCDGVSSCIDGGTVPCAPYACSGTACATTCATDADCATTAYCQTTTNQCLPRQANGMSCTAGNQCTTGNCVDGVCCNGACAGTCASCAVTGMRGICSTVPDGTSDPGTCAAPMVCSGSAACLLGLGQSCSMGSQCHSGSCVDGVCCNTACGANCFACDVAGSAGTCTEIPDGNDPDNDCPGGAVCDGTGLCRAP